ncbi:MAG: ABC transporter permease [Planctomycetota bacterium]|nr:ABC transporter permease [Planctomycetota bacterium]
MGQKTFLYGKGFDYILAVPLVLYLVLILALVSSQVTMVNGEAIREAFANAALRYSIKLSLVTSVVSTLLSVLVAMPAGYVLSRHRFPGHFVFDTVLDLPIVLPPLVVGLCVLIFFNTGVGRLIDRGLVEEGLFIYQPLGIVLVQFVVGCAFAVRTIKAGFDSLDPRYEEVAMTLGAGRVQCFYKVVLPNIIPSLIAGAVMSWARIFGLFGPILLVAGTMRYQTEIMPTTIYLETSIGRIEVALVIGIIMTVISVAALVLFKRLGGKGYLW